MRSSPFFHSSPFAVLVPSWAAAPNEFQPDAQSHESLVDSVKRLLRRFHTSVTILRGYQRASWAKRSLDIIVSSVALLLLSPLLLVVAAAIALSDGGPVLFWQERVGLYGDTFQFPKFRSMVSDAEARKRELRAHNMHGNGVTFKIQDDPRVTPIGRILRRYSIDELPQLYCVLRGEMSLVGPRPAVPEEVERYADHHRTRLHTLPGLTCTWQVSGRSEIPFEQQVKLDADYVERRSFWLDLSLLARTVPAVLSGRGAY